MQPKVVMQDNIIEVFDLRHCTGGPLGEVVAVAIVAVEEGQFREEELLVKLIWKRLRHRRCSSQLREGTTTPDARCEPLSTLRGLSEKNGQAAVEFVLHGGVKRWGGIRRMKCRFPVSQHALTRKRSVQS